jgi:methylated-DNA-[protein]-cysteine S-methyltransferase
VRPEEAALAVDLFATGWGWAAAAWSDSGLRRLILPRKERREAEKEIERHCGPGVRRRPRHDLRRQLGEYFKGRRRVFSIPLDVTAAGSFSGRVLAFVKDIPYGSTVTYGEVARAVGCPGAARAVGGTMSRNPLPILIPCHRVVAADGPGGFSGGLPKSRLLELEEGRRPLSPGCRQACRREGRSR